ncbi:MAG: tail tape measure protein [Sphingomicrobium sp.]
MDENIEELVLRVRTDTSAFSREVGQMRGELEGPLATGATRAGRVIEGALSRAISGGKFGFDDLKRVALTALGEIASAALRSVLSPGAQGGAASGLGNILSSLIGSIGAPGRATGGPVSAGRAYWVGERGPELFVPPGAGRVEPNHGGSGRNVNVSIGITSPTPGDPQLLQKSSRQIARAVRAAIGNAR